MGRRIEQVLKAYNKKPTAGITASFATVGERECIRFEGDWEYSYYVNVFDDGSIGDIIKTRAYLPARLLSCFTDTVNMETLKAEFPDMHKLILAVSNDLKILKLREENPTSYVFDDSYDEQAIERALSDWKESTGYFVHLDKEQKARLYKELLRRESEPLMMSSTRQITEWFKSQDIPFIRSGTVSITVDSEKSQICFYGDIRVSATKTFPHNSIFALNKHVRCDDQMRCVAKELLAIFGVGPERT